MLTLRLYMLQRLTALLMAPLVLGHLALMIYAIQDGLSAEEILGRTQGSFAWFAFYGLFVISVAIHGAIGLRVVLHEWARINGKALEVIMYGSGLVLCGLGARAVWAVTFA